MFVSGLAHPSFSRSFGGSINEPVEVDGESYVSSRANPRFIVRVLKLAVTLRMHAMTLWSQSCAPAAGAPPG